MGRWLPPPRALPASVSTMADIPFGRPGVVAVCGWHTIRQPLTLVQLLLKTDASFFAQSLGARQALHFRRDFAQAERFQEVMDFLRSCRLIQNTEPETPSLALSTLQPTNSFKHKSPINPRPAFWTPTSEPLPPKPHTLGS